ncbi:hypothetical protein [Clostridium sporogenes]|nr:hypothetical protein [Clostridium sporogenes]
MIKDIFWQWYQESNLLNKLEEKLIYSKYHCVSKVGLKLWKSRMW